MAATSPSQALKTLPEALLTAALGSRCEVLFSSPPQADLEGATWGHSLKVP